MLPKYKKPQISWSCVTTSAKILSNTEKNKKQHRLLEVLVCNSYNLPFV